MSRTDGSVVDYAIHRLDALMVEYYSFLQSSKSVRMDDLYAHIVSRPAPRFWVSPRRAAFVLSLIRKGASLESMRPSKRRMFLEIYRRVSEIAESRPGVPLSSIVEEVVFSPAPEFYLTPGSAKIMLSNYKKIWFRKKMRKWLR